MNIIYKLDKTLDTPLYIQIQNHIITNIKEGHFKKGDKLPSQRELAKLYGVNRSTVINALDELISKDILESKTKRGTIIKDDTWSILSNQNNLNWMSFAKSGSFYPNLNTVRTINEYDNKDLIKIGAGELSNDFFKKDIMKTLLNDMKVNINSLKYEEAKGSYALRVLLCNYFKTIGIDDINPDKILIVSGALQALHLISIGILNRNSTLLTEMPSYVNSLRVFQSADVNLYGIQMDTEGIIAKNIKKAKRISKASLLYTIPYFHNPTGVSISEKRRAELLEICNELKLPIIEDDTYRELYFDKPYKPLKAYDKNDLVLLTGSMSKILFPGLRLGWIIGKEIIIDKLADLKMQIDYGTSSLSQEACISLLKNNLFEKALDENRKELKNKRDYMLNTLDMYFKDIASWNNPNGGYYIWLELNTNISLKKLFDNALKKHILIHPGDIYHHSKKNHIRLSYSHASYEEILYSLKTLSKLIKIQIKNN